MAPHLRTLPFLLVHHLATTACTMKVGTASGVKNLNMKVGGKSGTGLLLIGVRDHGTKPIGTLPIHLPVQLL